MVRQSERHPNRPFEKIARDVPRQMQFFTRLSRIHVAGAGTSWVLDRLKTAEFRKLPRLGVG
jgi:hypothetical protein